MRIAESAAGETVGWIHAHERVVLEGGTWCEIAGLVVDSGRRRSGAGRALVDAVEAWASARGLRTVKVRSNVSRAEARPFYERLGYSRIKTQHVYRKEVTPAHDAA